MRNENVPSEGKYLTSEWKKGVTSVCSVYEMTYEKDEMWGVEAVNWWCGKVEQQKEGAGVHLVAAECDGNERRVHYKKVLPREIFIPFLFLRAPCAPRFSYLLASSRRLVRGRSSCQFTMEAYVNIDCKGF